MLRKAGVITAFVLAAIAFGLTAIFASSVAEYAGAVESTDRYAGMYGAGWDGGPSSDFWRQRQSEETAKLACSALGGVVLLGLGVYGVRRGRARAGRTTSD